MESLTKNKKTASQIAKMVERAFNGLTLSTSEDAVVELKDGWFNVAYQVCLSDGQEVILKIAPPPSAEVMTYEQNIMATEVEMMALVSKNPAIPVPAIYHFDASHDICDSDYFFMQKITGHNLDHIRQSLSQDTQTLIDHQIGGIIRQINQFTGTYFGYAGNPTLQANNWQEAFIKIMDAVLEDGIRKNVDYFGITVDTMRQHISNHASALDEVSTPQLVHWDAWEGNIFVENGHVTGIIDFERALWGDPLMETQFRSITLDRPISKALDGYGKTSFTHAEYQRSNLYTLYLGLIMHTECFYRDYQTDYAKDLILPSIRWFEQQ